MNPLSSPISAEQIVSLVHQLAPDEQARVLHALFVAAVPDRNAWLQQLQQHGQAHLRQLAATHGYDWDQMDDAARLALVDDLLHDALP